MGAVAHYIEAEGVPTSGISLVRENTVAIRPPRALWVSYPLGRPFGAPLDAGLQRRTLQAVLALLDRTDGPVILEDFPEDAPPEAPEEMDGLVCPVPLPRQPAAGATTGRTVLIRAELAALGPWYRLAVENNGRTTVGVSGLEIGAIVDLLDGVIGGAPVPSVAGRSAAQTLRYATEDLRNWYLEAASARPGGAASMAATARWFWSDTAAGALILALYPVAAADPDPAVRQLAERTLIPRAFQPLLRRS